jgi:hypothetical protein
VRGAHRIERMTLVAQLRLKLRRRRHGALDTRPSRGGQRTVG